MASVSTDSGPPALARTLLSERAYARAFSSTAERIALLPHFLDFYNRRRPHWSLAGQPPARQQPAWEEQLAAALMGPKWIGMNRARRRSIGR